MNTRLITEIKEKAEMNAAERLEIIKDIRAYPELVKQITTIDDSFSRKIYSYPGDITTARIARVLKKLGY